MSLGYLARLSAGGAFDQSVQLNPTAKAIADAGTGLVNVAPELTRLAAQAAAQQAQTAAPVQATPTSPFHPPFGWTWGKTAAVGAGALVALILLLRRR